MSLIDCNGNVINQEDIIQFENAETQIFYLYSGNMLYRYNKLGEVDTNALNNIKIDAGVTLINDTIMKWTRLGTKEEIYNKIFK